MTEPCIDPAYFDSPGGEISPKRHWQFAHRASAVAGGATFTPASNPSPGTQLFNVMAQWTNTTPVAQQVYAVMTQGAVRYSIDCLKHLVILHQWGTSFGASPADPTMTDESRVRGYPDLGTGTAGGGTVAVYFLLEDRHPTITIPIGDVVTLAPGQTLKAKAQVSWHTAAWGINWWTQWGDPIPHRLGKVGPVQIDIFSTPVIA